MLDDLECVYFEGTIEDWCNIDFEFSSSNPASSYAKICINNEEIVSLKISDSIKELKLYAFLGFSSIKEVVIDNNLYSSNGKMLYKYCPANSNELFIMNDDIEDISLYAFRGVCFLTKAFNEIFSVFFHIR